MEEISQPGRASFRSKFIKSGALLFASRGVAQGCSFLRNVLVARIIGADNFGIAATFSITMSFLEMLGSISVDKMLIQAQDGESAPLQASAHAIRAIRGALSGLLLVAVAWPIAKVYDVPQATWAFRYLALVPFLRGLAHLDPQRKQRQLDYWASAKLDVFTQLIPLLAAWPLALWLKDYSVMVWLLILQAFVEMVGSLVLSSRPYRWLWDRQYTKRFLSFGWPLVLNSILLFGIFQGDRLLIAADKTLAQDWYSFADLGVYSVAVSLTLTPMVALSNVSSALLLPLFSRSQTDLATLNRHYTIASQIIAFVSGFFALPLIVSGGWIVRALYGKNYEAAGAFIGWLAAMQAMRMARFVPTAAAMAFADTKNAMVSNLVRTSMLVMTLLVVIYGGPLKWIAMSGFIGEFFGLATCLWRLDRDHKIPNAGAIKAMGVVLGSMGLAGLSVAFLPVHGALNSLLLLIASLAVFSAIMLHLFPTLRSLVWLREWRVR